MEAYFFLPSPFWNQVRPKAFFSFNANQAKSKEAAHERDSQKFWNLVHLFLDQKICN